MDKYFMKGLFERIIWVMGICLSIFVVVLQIRDILSGNYTIFDSLSIFVFSLAFMVSIFCILNFIPYIKFYKDRIVILYFIKEITLYYDDIEKYRGGGCLRFSITPSFFVIFMKNRKKYFLIISSYTCCGRLERALDKKYEPYGIKT